MNRARGDLDHEDLPIRDRTYERFGEQGLGMPTYPPPPWDPEEAPRAAHGSARVALGKPFAPGPRGYRRTDERIHDEVCGRLTDAGDVDATDVEVAVEDGDVLLSGTVADRRQRERAEIVAERVHGVRDVVNRLRVVRPERR